MSIRVLAIILAAGVSVAACSGTPATSETPNASHTSGASPTCSSCGSRACGSGGSGEPCGSAAAAIPTCDAGRPAALLPPDPAADPDDDYIDPVTGHRIVRLSRLPNGGNTFYFTQNEFNCRGDTLVFANTYGARDRWLYSIDLETLRIEPLTDSPGGSFFEVVAPRRNEVIYLTGSDLMATNIDTRRTRTIARLPAGTDGFTVNADESLIAGFYNEGIADYRIKPFGTFLSEYYLAHRLSYVFTVDAETGAFRKIHQENDWIDHTQFSPTDPSLLIFSHEGPADAVTDRIWAMDAIAAGTPRSLYPETMANELVSHEFFSHDGAKVYFDHQAGGAYSIGSVDLATGASSDLTIPAEDWGLHYNVSHDGLTFASDGDHRERKMALLYHVTPEGLQMEELADLGMTDYQNQPLVQFTHDDRWVVFQAGVGDKAQVYAVEVAKH